jgi:GNAT superfamily N-acetyltransferase
MIGLAAIRPARSEDLPRLVAAADQIFRPAAGQPGQRNSMGHDYPLLFSAENAPNLHLAEAEGAIVGHAGFTLRPAVCGASRFQVACFGAVFTDPGWRGRGLARHLFERAMTQARDLGADAALVSGSGGLYLRAGFSPLPACVVYPATVGSPPPLGLEVAPAEPNDIPELARLYDSEPARFVRDHADWERLLEAGVVFYHPGRLLLVRRHGQAAGYLAVADRPRPPGGPVAHPRALELGGDRRALADALPLVLARLGAPEIELVQPPGDPTLASLAAARGWAARALRFPFCAARWTDAAPASELLPWYGLNYV